MVVVLDEKAPIPNGMKLNTFVLSINFSLLKCYVDYFHRISEKIIIKDAIRTNMCIS